MSGEYDKYLYMEYPIPTTRPRMSPEDRAAQFSPFAALTGYEAAVRETGRLTETRSELSEEERVLLDRQLGQLLDRIGEQPEVTVTWFLPDERKAGGSWVTTSGRLLAVSRSARQLMLTDGRRVDLDAVQRLDSPVFRQI